MGADTPTVLVVDDEQNVVDAYALWLDDECDVRTAAGGEEALEAVNDDIDAVLLDRRMPDISGDEVLTEIRERDVECRVAMVTAVDPDFDILEMPFDAYLTKPVEKADLEEVVERLLSLREYDRRVEEQFALAEKLAAIQAEKTEEELAESEEYAALEERMAELREESADVMAEMDDESLDAVFGDFGTERY